MRADALRPADVVADRRHDDQQDHRHDHAEYTKSTSHLRFTSFVIHGFANPMFPITCEGVVNGKWRFMRPHRRLRRHLPTRWGGVPSAPPPHTVGRSCFAATSAHGGEELPRAPPHTVGRSYCAVTSPHGGEELLRRHLPTRWGGVELS